MARVDGAAQQIQSKPARKQVQKVGSVRSQPLAGKSFYLDLPSGKSLEFLAKSVKRFGGVVESFLSKEVTCIVSNSQEARKESWGEKQTASVLRNARAGTQRLGRGHRDTSQKPADAVLVTRGKALLHKAIGNQSSTCGGNSILANAQSWGIQIIHVDAANEGSAQHSVASVGGKVFTLLTQKMVSYIQCLDLKSCRSTRQMKCFPSRPQSALKVVRLQSPFLKVEDESRRLRPFLQQFKNFPELFFPELRRHSPFDPPPSPASPKAPKGQPTRSVCSSDSSLVPKRQRGYCECCEEDFADLQTHLQSPQHTAFVLDASHYAPVDSLISQMTNDFAVSSWSSLPLRVPLVAYGHLSGLQEDIVETITASSGQTKKSCLSGEGSVGQPVSRGSSACLPEDQSFWGQMALPSPSLQSRSGQVGGSSNPEPCGRGGADAPPEPTASLAGGSWAASQKKKSWPPPTLLPPRPHKRKLSYSTCGPAQKRPALTGWPLSQPDTNALPGIPPVGTTECSFFQEYGSQTDPRCLRLPAVPAAKPHCLRAPTQFPQEGSCCPPREHAVTDMGCLSRLVQQLEQKEGSAVHPSDECHEQTPCKFPCVDSKLGTLSFPAGKCLSSQWLGPVVQPYGVGPSQFIQTVVPERSSPGLPPLSCSEEPPSSESEWDRPLLCALEGSSRLSFERPMDSALLGTCISLRDSGYESHLSSVLWRTLEPHEAHKGNSSSCHGHREGPWAPLNSLSTCLDRLGPFS